MKGFTNVTACGNVTQPPRFTTEMGVPRCVVRVAINQWDPRRREEHASFTAFRVEGHAVKYLDAMKVNVGDTVLVSNATYEVFEGPDEKRHHQIVAGDDAHVGVCKKGGA